MTNDKTTDMIAITVAEHKTAAFAARCDLSAARLRALAALGGRPDTDAGAVDVAATVTADLLADPEALLAVALTIEQQRATALATHLTPAGAEPSAHKADPAAIPPPGWYWARLSDRGTVSPWVVVEVTERNGRRYVDIAGSDEGAPAVAEWGPRMEPPEARP